MLGDDPLQHRQKERHNALRGGDGRGRMHSSLRRVSVLTLALSQQRQGVVEQRLTAHEAAVARETEAQDLPSRALNALKGSEAGGGDLKHTVSFKNTGVAWEEGGVEVYSPLHTAS